MRREFLTAAALAVIAAGPARPDDPKAKGPADLQGCWKLVSIEAGGKGQAPVGGSSPRWVVKGDKVLYGGEEAITLAADPATDPKALDLKLSGPDRMYEGIYSVEKDTLKVCVNARADAKDRPGKLSTEGQDGWRLFVFEREKAAPADPAEGHLAFAGVRLKADAEAGSVLIDAPLQGTPAEKAGLKGGDVVLKVGGAAVADADAAVKAVRAAKPGKKLEFRVKRGDKEVDVTVTPGVMPFHVLAGLE